MMETLRKVLCTKDLGLIDSSSTYRHKEEHKARPALTVSWTNGATAYVSLCFAVPGKLLLRSDSHSSEIASLHFSPLVHLMSEQMLTSKGPQNLHIPSCLLTISSDLCNLSFTVIKYTQIAF